MWNNTTRNNGLIEKKKERMKNVLIKCQYKSASN